MQSSAATSNVESSATVSTRRTAGNDFSEVGGDGDSMTGVVTSSSGIKSLPIAEQIQPDGDGARI